MREPYGDQGQERRRGDAPVTRTPVGKCEEEGAAESDCNAIPRPCALLKGDCNEEVRMKEWSWEGGGWGEGVLVFAFHHLILF